MHWTATLVTLCLTLIHADGLATEKEVIQSKERASYAD